MATKFGRNNEFWQKGPHDTAYNMQIIKFVKIAPSHTVSEIHEFSHFTQKFKMTPKKCHMTVYNLKVKNFVKIAPSRPVSEILKTFIFIS